MGGGFPPFNQGQKILTQNTVPFASSSWKPSSSSNLGYSFPIGSQPETYNAPSWNFGPQPRLPFLAMLNLIDLSNIMKDLVFHDMN